MKKICNYRKCNVEFIPNKNGATNKYCKAEHAKLENLGRAREYAKGNFPEHKETPHLNLLEKITMGK